MKCIDSITNFTKMDACSPSCNEVAYQTAVSSAKIADIIFEDHVQSGSYYR